MQYHKWFLAHSGINKNLSQSMNDKSQSSQNVKEGKISQEENLLNINLPKRRIYDYEAWFERHSTKNEFITRETRFKEIYTQFVKKLYPLILESKYIIEKNICDKHNKIFSYFCFTCEKHFCSECENNHKGHSSICFSKIKIKEEELNKKENLIKVKISSLFRETDDVQSNNTIKRAKYEVMKFNYFVINSYRRESNDFFNYFNYYYLFKLSDDLINKKDNILIKFFGLHGFRTIINDLKNHFEKTKIRWLLKNLISYQKNEIRKKRIEKRKSKYTFENIDIFLQNEGFKEDIINKIKEIIKEVKDNVDYKRKIFNFIIESADIFKKNQDLFLKELNIILEQIKVNFKEMVKQKVGNTEDVKKFLKQKNFYYYVGNNYGNNQYINNYEEIKENNVEIKKEVIKYINENGEKSKNNNKLNDIKENLLEKEFDLYKGFKIKSYGDEYSSINLDLSNIFEANNNNNNYIKKNEKYINKNNTYTTINITNIYKKDKIDILKSMNNINKNEDKVLL